VNALAREIRLLIGSEGPISLSRFMALALGHPMHGYYMRREPFGRGGDFITAPEISQMFGELLGLWIGQCWLEAGRPAPFDLVEIGPGRGTLMADALRALVRVPDCLDAAERLREEQRALLAGRHPRLGWAASLGDVPSCRPLFLLANEFLDALPIRQFQRRGGQWFERLVGLDAEGRFVLGLATDAAALGGAAPEGAVIEVCEDALAFGRALGARLASHGGAALIIDYGHAASGFGDTVQAMRGHAFTDPLADPGAVDITAHVDFQAFGAACRAGGGATHGPVTQADLLERLGIGARAAALGRQATPQQAEAVQSALQRLTAREPRGMGGLFKALAVMPPGVPSPPGF
jgi:NADH dehydrogenase [ubiquinone] 1 alpha subcomplex assembly factor 7